MHLLCTLLARLAVTIPTGGALFTRAVVQIYAVAQIYAAKKSALLAPSGEQRHGAALQRFTAASR